MLTRKQKRINIPFENAGQIPDSSNDERELISEKERVTKLLYNAIGELDTGDKFIILSFYNHEKSIREISEISGLSESNIKVKLHRIKKRLSILIGDKIDLCYG